MYSQSIREGAVDLIGVGRSLNSISKQSGISRSALRQWRDHGLHPRRPDFRCFVCQGRRPRHTADYAALFGFYLGDGCLSCSGRTFALRVSCDRTYPAIITDVTALIESVHERGKVCHVNAPGAIVVQNCWNHWPYLFPQHGPGRKHERSLSLQPWQRDIVEQYPADFLRGLFHSDGCRVRNWATRVVKGEKKRYEYPRWQFSNNSADIMGWSREALDLLDIPWRQSSWKTLSVSTRAGVAKLDDVIGLKS